VNFVCLTIDASKRKEQRHRKAGTLAAWPSIVGATGAEVPFSRNIIGNFVVYQDRLETYLLQLFAHPET